MKNSPTGMSRAFCWGQKTQRPIRAPFSSSNLCSSAHLVPHCMILSLLASLSPPWQRQPRTSKNTKPGGETLVLRWRRSHPRPSLSTLAINNMIQIFGILKVRVHSENYLTQTYLKHCNCKKGNPTVCILVQFCHSIKIVFILVWIWPTKRSANRSHIKVNIHSTVMIQDLKRAVSLICSCLSWQSSFAGMVESGKKTSDTMAAMVAVSRLRRLSLFWC